MSLIKLKSRGLTLSDTFAFTGTVSGASGASLNIDNYFHAQDQKSSNTDGGTLTGGSFITRVFNTVVTNSISGASLSSNQITLPSGTYYVWGRAPTIGTARTGKQYYIMQLIILLY